MIKYFLENRVSAFMVLLAFFTAGALSLWRLPVSLLPASDFPALSVIIEYPGITPDKMESLITRPVERILKTVNGITEMQSESEEGKSRINLTFADGTDVKIAAVNVREKIELISDSFPREVQEPVVMRYDPSDRPVIITAVEIDGMDRSQIRDYAERRIKPALQRIEGISEINIAGGDMREIHVEADRSRLEARGLSLDDLASGIRRGNVSLPCGVVESGKGNMVLYLPARFRTAGEMNDVMVSSSDSKGVYLRDIAVVTFSPRERDDMSRYNGREMVTLYVHKGSGANTLSVCREAESILKSFSDVKFTAIYNQGEYVGSSVENAAFSGLWGMLIVAAVLLLFYRKIETVMPIALSIPASMMAVPVFLYFGGRGINVMSLSGFALGAGMVVTNGIMVIEAIAVRGGDPGIVPDAVYSMKGAVTASTLTHIAVFLPLMAVSRKAGSTYGDMAYTVVWALLVSLFAALVLVPSFYISIKKSKNKNRGIINGGGRVKKISGMVSSSVEEIETRLNEFYRAVLNYSFEKRGRVTAAAGGIFFISLIIFSVLKTDNFSDQGGGEFYLYLEFPTGLSLDATNRGVSAVEEMARGLSGIKSVSAKVEKWRGTLTVKPEPELGMGKTEELKSELKRRSDDIMKSCSAFAYISEADEIASRELSIHFIGDDSETLKGIAREAASGIRKIDGIDECLLRFRDGRPEYLFAVDRERAAAGRVSHAAIADTTRNSLFGPVVTKFIDSDREVDVRVRLNGDDRGSIERVRAGMVVNEEGTMIPLSSLVNLSEGDGMTRIYRLNGRRSFSVTAKIGNLSFQEGEYRIRKFIETMKFPSEYTYEFDSRLKEFKEEKREMIISIALSVLLIYMILASLFESMMIPLLIMITIPLASAGVAPLLLLTFTPLSPPVYLGIIVLSGIVVNNGIILTDAVRSRVSMSEKGLIPLHELIKDTALEKFRPVVITTSTTILGMIPMLVSGGDGSSLWRPFALTVISGLLFSTLLTMVVLPVMSVRFFEGKGDYLQIERG